MTNLNPVAIWTNNPRQLLPTEYNFASNFNSQNQDVLNQSQFVRSQLQNLSTILNAIESKNLELSALNAAIVSVNNQLRLADLTLENDAIAARVDTTAAGFATISAAKLNAENETTATELAIGNITLDTKVQRLNPLLTELAALGKFNDRNLTVSGANSYNWATYSGVRVRPQIALVMENQNQGSNGGAVVANTWGKRELNTIKFLNVANGTLSNNTLTLPAGDYVAIGFSTFAGCAASKTKLQSGQTTIGLGASGNGTTDGGNVGRLTNNQAPIYTAFNLQETSEISLDFLATNNPPSLNSATQGRAAGIDTENYSQLFLIAATPSV
jgi:hypothetical protein